MAAKAYEASFGADENVLNLTVLTVALISEYIKSH